MTPHLFPAAACAALTLMSAWPAAAQGRAPQEPLPAGQTNDPFPQPIVSTEGAVSYTHLTLPTNREV